MDGMPYQKFGLIKITRIIFDYMETLRTLELDLVTLLIDKYMSPFEPGIRISDLKSTSRAPGSWIIIAGSSGSRDGSQPLTWATRHD